MHISWQFLDKKAAAIKAIMSYGSMDFIIRNTDDEIEAERTKIVGFGSPKLSGLPGAHNPQAGEERIINCLDEIDLMKERYLQAQEYMAWFKPAWDELSEDEQYVLDTFFRNDEGYAAEVVSDYFGIERSSAYNKKNRALQHLTTMLYGKN